MPAKVQHSLPVLCFDNENTDDIFNLENNTPGRQDFAKLF